MKPATSAKAAGEDVGLASPRTAEDHGNAELNRSFHVRAFMFVFQGEAANSFNDQAAGLLRPVNVSPADGPSTTSRVSGSAARPDLAIDGPPAEDVVFPGERE